jgi:cell division transport system permease protein
VNLLIREHISLIIALFTILFTLQVFFIIDRTINIYEDTLKNNYSIIAVTGKPLNGDLVKDSIGDISKIDMIDPQKVIDRLRDELNKDDLGALKDSLPDFYRIFLKKYPAPAQLELIRDMLLQMEGVIRVETYGKAHDQTYKLLVLFKDISNVLLIAIFIVSALLVIKEMRIWQFEHTERMNIMALFGAPLWMRSAVLFKVAIFDALISSILVVITFIVLDMNGWLHNLFSMISVEVDIFEFFEDTTKLFTIAVVLSLTLAVITILKNSVSSRGR